MEIVPIFDEGIHEECRLWTVRFTEREQDEYGALYDLFDNTGKLEEFIESKSEFLRSDFWKGMPVSEAVHKIQSEWDDLDMTLEALSFGSPISKDQTLDDLFKPLVQEDFSGRFNANNKAKIDSAKAIVRLYALKLEDDTYVITGGGIKLVAKMSEDPDLEKELFKMERVKQFLKENGISGPEDIISAFYD